MTEFKKEGMKYVKYTLDCRFKKEDDVNKLWDAIKDHHVPFGYKDNDNVAMFKLYDGSTMYGCVRDNKIILEAIIDTLHVDNIYGTIIDSSLDIFDYGVVHDVSLWYELSLEKISEDKREDMIYKYLTHIIFDADKYMRSSFKLDFVNKYISEGDKIYIDIDVMDMHAGYTMRGLEVDINKQTPKEEYDKNIIDKYTIFIDILNADDRLERYRYHLLDLLNERMNKETSNEIKESIKGLISYVNNMNKDITIDDMIVLDKMFSNDICFDITIPNLLDFDVHTDEYNGTTFCDLEYMSKATGNSDVVLLCSIFLYHVNLDHIKPILLKYDHLRHELINHINEVRGSLYYCTYEDDGSKKVHHVFELDELDLYLLNN